MPTSDGTPGDCSVLTRNWGPPKTAVRGAGESQTYVYPHPRGPFGSAACGRHVQVDGDNRVVAIREVGDGC